jgi:hypothetical protein
MNRVEGTNTSEGVNTNIAQSIAFSQYIVLKWQSGIVGAFKPTVLFDVATNSFSVGSYKRK